MKFLRGWLLALSLALLLASHAVLSAELWLGSQGNTFSFLQPLDCIIALFCRLHFQRYFGIALIGIVVALVLAYFAQRHARPTTLERDRSVSALSFNPVSPVWRKWCRLGLILAVPMVALLAIFSLTAGNPPPLLWLLTIALVAVTFYGADRASLRGGLLTQKELLLLAVYVIFLLLLGYAYRNDLTRLVAIGISLLLAAWLWRTQTLPREAIAFGVLVMLAFAIYTFDLMSWRYSFIGDEYAFFESANNMINGVNRPYILSPMGTYDVHPVFATYVQAATLTLYGNDVYGWRISETLALMLAALPLYVLVRTFVNSRAALLGLVVYLASQHLLGLSKVGYTYSQLLVPLLSSLAIFMLAARRRSLLGVFLSGVACAFAFYTFAFGIPFIALLVLLFALRDLTINPVGATVKRLPQRLHSLVPTAAALILGIGLTAMPSLSDAQALQRIAGHTIANSEVRSGNNLTEQVIPNFLYTASASLSFLGHSHYVSGAHLDPLSSSLMLLGVGAAVVTVYKSRISLWLILSFLLSCLFVGGFAPYPYPPIARTYILIPLYALFAAMGAAQLLGGLESARRMRTLTWAFLMLAIPALNLYQFFVLTPRTNPQESLALLVKEFQEQPSLSTFYLVERLPFNYNVTRMVLKAYNLNPDKLLIISDENPAASLPAIARSSKDNFAILVDWAAPMRERWRTGLRQWWTERNETKVSDAAGVIHYAKLMVSDASSDGVARATAKPSTTPASAFIVTPGFLPRVLGAWKVELPRDVAVTAAGLVYVINGARNSIEIHQLDGKLVRTLSGDWKEPFALAFNSHQELLVLDSATRTVTRTRTDGAVLARSDNDVGLSSPRGLAIGGNDDVYIADTGGGRIVRLNRELLEPEVLATSIALKQPTSLTFIGDQLVVTDGPMLYVLSPSGEVAAQWPITPFNTNQPPRFLHHQSQTIVMTDPEAGELVLFDLQGHLVQRIAPPNYERMRKPMGITAAGDGKILIAENEGDLVRIVEWGTP